MSILAIISISSIFTIIIGLLILIVFYIGERFGITPVIILGNLSWATAGEAVIIYILCLLFSVFIGSFIVLYLIRKYY